MVLNAKFKKGDTTSDGFEVVEVRLKPIYKMRKRITVNRTNPYIHKKYKGKKGWVYSDGECGVWYELDSFPNRMFRFRDIEITY